MRQQRGAIVGRDAELAALRGDGPRTAMVVLRGPSGSGKTAMLAELGRDLASGGNLVLMVAGAAEHPSWDSFGVLAVLGAIREKFDAIGAAPGLTEAVAAVSRLCTAETYATQSGSYRLIHALSALFGVLGARKPVAFLVEDIELITSPTLVLSAMRSSGHLVVASCGAEQAGLSEVADRVLDLGPLADEDADALLRQVAGMPADDVLRSALRRDLGPWYRNPGTLVSTMGDLRARGRLTTVHGHLCLRDPADPIALPQDHQLVGLVRSIGELARGLVMLAGADGEFGVDEIPVLAAATGASRLVYGRTVDRLVAAGVLHADPAGRLSTDCPALGTAVTGRNHVGLLHRTIAEHLLDAGDDLTQRSAVLPGHLAAAGRAMPVRPDVLDLLLTDELPDRPLNPACDALRGYAAWWHAVGEPRRDRIASDVVRLLIRCGDFAKLADFVAELLDADRTHRIDRRALAAAAVLAAVHVGGGLSGPVRAALGGTRELPALGLFDRLFIGADIQVTEVASAFAPLARWCLPINRCRQLRPDPALDTALAMRDLVPVFASVLGPDYRQPSDGPLAAVHRVSAGYADGDWTAALSAARELEINPNSDVIARQGTRLLAAEMCGWRGEDRRAAAWLASVPADSTVFAAMRGWVRTGMLHHAGDIDGAFDTAWTALRQGQERGESPGVSRLLHRMASLAVETGRAADARRVLTETEVWHESRGTVESAKTVLAVRGLVEQDGAEALAAERLFRRHGNRFELSLACQMVGETSGEPRPWLHEAHEIAKAIGATRLTARTRRSLRCHGVEQSTARTQDEQLSETELRITELIRLGRTNRQIAQALRMSEKTVEKYLTRLFAKAGCRTRYGLATSGLSGLPVGA